jgi:hypothetical protein
LFVFGLDNLHPEIGQEHAKLRIAFLPERIPSCRHFKMENKIFSENSLKCPVKTT